MKNWILIFALIFGASCQRHEINEYNINKVQVNSDGHQKKNLKSDVQFISLLYSDLYETSISSDKLNKLELLQSSFGDKNVVIQRISQNMLSDPLAVIPTDSVMFNQTKDFIINTYNKFLTRQPTEAEIWFLEDLISKNPKLTAKEFYYGFITSEEYKYY